MKKYSKFNIQPEDCTFYVNETKRTIACVYQCNRLDLIYAIEDIEKVDFPMFLNDMICLQGRYVGIAKCAPEDEWNEDIGRILSFVRMKEKFMHNFCKNAQRLIRIKDNKLDQFVDNINNFGAMGANDIEYYKTKIQRLLGQKK